jgi:hypothetical protein
MMRAVRGLRPYLTTLQSLEIPGQDIGTLYRLSADLPPPLQNRAGVFHIPFQLRQRVKTQRYSLPGVPCLYLGATSYVCEVEVSPAATSTRWISAFRVRHGKKMRVLNLAYRPAYLAAMLDFYGLQKGASKPGKLAVAGAVVWPLLAACSCERTHKADPFAVEYVLPQLLFSWVSEQPSLHGVRYFSSRVREYGCELLTMNFALPARNGGRTGHSPELLDLLEWTEPREWNDALHRGAGSSAKVRSGSVPTASGPVKYETTAYAAVDRGIMADSFGSP